MKAKIDKTQEKLPINQYEPSVLFVGHVQTVQTQIRSDQALHTSDQVLHHLLADILHVLKFD